MIVVCIFIILYVYQLKDSTDEEIPVAEMVAKINAVRQCAVESDQESTVDGRPTPNIHKVQLKDSSPVKILKPSVSLAKKFTQKKIDKTITAIGREKSTRLTKPAAPLKTPFRSTIPVAGITNKIIKPLTLVGRGYDPFEPVDKKKVKLLDDWIQLDE